MGDNVIRCKDCKYCHVDRAGNGACFHDKRYGTVAASIGPYDFCSYAQRPDEREADDEFVKKSDAIKALKDLQIEYLDCIGFKNDEVFDALQKAYARVVGVCITKIDDMRTIKDEGERSDTVVGD